MKLVVFTDLDATLLDPKTYEWLPAQQAVLALKARDSSLVLVSSKTHSEMLSIHRELGLSDPFIVENGGGIALSQGAPEQLFLRFRTKLGEPIPSHGGLLFALGIRYNELTKALDSMAVELGCQLHGFGSMSAERVAFLTGLSEQEAVGALARSFDEPFLIPDDLEGGDGLVHEAARRHGLTAVQGGRFWHLIGHSGKGEAVRVVIESYHDLWGPLLTVGLGDSPNDFPFLELVDIPVLLGDSQTTLEVPPALAGIRRNPKAGPEGWSDAVFGILDEIDARGA
jgi:mannosyl-3-phosphoglycerate phosphatase